MDKARDSLLPQASVALAIAAHVLIWSVCPALLIGNLHQDTLEAAYWGNDLAAPYARHPPLLSAILEVVLRLNHAPIFAILLMSQIGMAGAAFYVWRTARLFARPETAAVAVMLFLTSLAATFFAVQTNHNSILAPFWAAAQFYGLSWLESGKRRDAFLAGVTTGLGMLAKFEMALLPICLAYLAAMTPRYRFAFGNRASYGAFFVALAIFAPFFAWMLHSDGRAARYALGLRKVDDLSSLAASAVNLVDGQITLFLTPVAILLLASLPTSRGNSEDMRRVGAVLTFGPSVAMAIGGVVTDQVFKPLWVTPFASSCAVGLSLLCASDRGPRAAVIACRTALLTGALAATFVAWLFLAEEIGAAIGHPLTFYAADTRQLGEEAQKFWDAHAHGKLECVVIADPALAGSTVLWLRSRPRFIDLDHEEWSRPDDEKRCGETGGIVVETGTGREDRISRIWPALRSAPRRFIAVPAAFGFSHFEWPVQLTLLEPAARVAPN